MSESGEKVSSRTVLLSLHKTRTLGRSGSHRGAGDEFALELVRCARRVMREHGAGGFSVRKVAAEAHVSIGHLQHYFPTRADLLHAMVMSVEVDFYEYFLRHITPIRNPVERFVACAQYVLDHARHDDLIALLREFWAMSARDGDMAKSLSAFYTGCRRFVARMLCEANESLDYAEARRRSCTAVSALSGAFLYLEPWQRDEPPADFRDYLLGFIEQLPFIEPPTVPGA